MQNWQLLSNWQGLVVLSAGLALALALGLLWVMSRRMAAARKPLPTPLSMPQAETPDLKIANQDVSQGQTVRLSMMDRSCPANQHATGHSQGHAEQPAPAEIARADHSGDLAGDLARDLAGDLAEDQTDDLPEAVDQGSLGQKLLNYGSLGRDDAARRCTDLMVLAQTQISSSAGPAAAGSLREVIILAAANGLADQQAAARLELGELARQDGDLITACEHWQIARSLFHDLKNKPRVKAIETRMREHGCPTDWVLNDF